MRTVKWLVFGLVAVCCLLLFVAAQPAVVADSSGFLDDQENIAWTFDGETGTLTISGKGEMPKDASWCFNPALRRVVIQAGITTISNEAFMNCINLGSVEIPETVTSIGANAFAYTGLETIELHDGITDIGSCAFESSRLESVKIPAGVTEISFGTFRGCIRLTDIQLHGGITQIGNDAFRKCNALTQIHIPEGVRVIHSAFQYCENLRSVTIPDSVTSLGGTFDGCTALEEVNLGSGVETVGRYTFRSCESLRHITLPDSVKTIGSGAFAFCDALETLTAGTGLATVEERAFDDCGKLRYFEISADNPHLLSADGAIYQKDPFELVRIPPAYQGKLEVLSGVTKVQWYAGYQCTGLTELVLPDSVAEISHHAFEDCKNLVSVKMPEALVMINSQAFYNCESLRSIVIPSKVERIEICAFSGCDDLKRITFQGTMPYIASGAFVGIVADAYYPEGDTTWKDGWQDYSGKLTWPQNGPEDPYSGKCGENAFWRFDPETATMTIFGTGPMTDKMGWYSSDYSELIFHVVIEEGITYIGHGAFSSMRQLQTVKMAKSVTHIGYEAFRNCPITSIELHEGITQIDDAAFMSTDLVSVTIPSTLKVIEYQTFLSCRSLLQVTLHDSVTTIDNGAFRGCDMLETITIPDSVQILGWGAFSGCSRLKQVKLSAALTEIPGSAFSGCEALEEIFIPDSVTKIDQEAFSGCASLTTVYIGAGVAEFAYNPFETCESLTKFVVSAGNQHFIADGYGAIYSADGSVLMLVPTGLRGEYQIMPGTSTIGAFAFCTNSMLETVVMPDSVTAIEENAFYNCTGLKTVIVSRELVRIGVYAFSSCKKLQQLEFGPKLETIGYGAFQQCTSMIQVSFAGDKPSYDRDTFSGISAKIYRPAGNPTWENGRVLCAGGHKPVAGEGKMPTCSEKGLTDGMYCALCGWWTQLQQEIPLEAHRYGDWETLYYPTAEYTGMEQRTCVDCNHLEQRELPMLDPDVTKPTAPTEHETQPSVPTVKPLPGDVLPNDGLSAWLIIGICAAVALVVGTIVIVKTVKRKDI